MIGKKKNHADGRHGEENLQFYSAHHLPAQSAGSSYWTFQPADKGQKYQLSPRPTSVSVPPAKFQWAPLPRLLSGLRVMRN